MRLASLVGLAIAAPVLVGACSGSIDDQSQLGRKVHGFCDAICSGCPQGNLTTATCQRLCLGDFETVSVCRDEALARLACQSQQSPATCYGYVESCRDQENAWKTCSGNASSSCINYGPEGGDSCDITAPCGDGSLEAKCSADSTTVQCSCRQDGHEVGTCTWSSSGCWTNDNDALVACCFDVFFP